MEKIKVAIYTRVSTRDQALEGYSLDAQERVLLEYCTARKYNVYKIYTDEGISAKDIKHRPGMLALLDDAKEKKFEAILIWKLTRFSRNLADLTATCEMLDKLGIALVSYSEAFDSNTPAGRMVRSMLGTVAQFEREVTAENVVLGMLERAKQGKRTCHHVLGYEKDGRDSFKIDPIGAEKVRFIYDSYLIYKSITEVTELCRIKDIRGQRGSQFRTQGILTILTRPVYAGYNLFQGNIYKGIHPAIIPVQKFNKVQRLILRQGKIVGQHRKSKIYVLPEE